MRNGIPGVLIEGYSASVSLLVAIGTCCGAGAAQVQSSIALGHLSPMLFNNKENKQPVTEKECLAAKLAIHRFRPYVEMMPFTVITDHASLQWLMSLKDLSGRLARWSLELQAFPFSMRYKKGADNVVADTLSRSVEEVESTPEDLLGFETLEFESPDYQELVQEAMSQEQRLPDLKVQNGMLFKRMTNEALDDEVEGTSWKFRTIEDGFHAVLAAATAFIQPQQRLSLGQCRRARQAATDWVANSHSTDKCRRAPNSAAVSRAFVRAVLSSHHQQQLTSAGEH
ncbi:hypothetical protein ACLKA7_012207 [Drosophila subpalustris]